MSQFGQEFSPNEAPALPLWVDGRACLMMAGEFHVVVNGAGQALRRVPLYGDDAVAAVADSTVKAVPVWRDFDPGRRAACFRSLGEHLARYRAHFCKLLEDETGMSHESAESEMTQALAAIDGVPLTAKAEEGIVAIASDAAAPLAVPLSCAVDALAAGWAVVLKPSATAPSALFAMAELFTRAGFPAGLVNCVHGDEQVIRSLCANPAISLLVFSGSAEIGRRVASIAESSDKSCLVESPDSSAQGEWRALFAGAKPE